MTARICLIDDDVILLKALAIGLRRAGYEVVTAPGAAAALDLAQREPFDAVVTDMKMPGMSGADLIAQLRATSPAMPIVAISGAAALEGRSVVDTARALGANALLAKPFRAEDLEEILAPLLGSPVTSGSGHEH
jgi:DNA-binding NtrC family response regulator